MNLRPIGFAAIAPTLLISVASWAQMPMECTQATMTKTNADIARMQDSTKRAAAMKEMEMAKKMFDTKDVKACVGHMNTAMTMMK